MEVSAQGTQRLCTILPMPRTLPDALFPLMRRLADGRFHSGQALAHEYGISRASVFNFIRIAETLGLTFRAVRGRGYQLVAPPEWLDAQQIESALGLAAPKYHLRIFDVVDSTNSALMAAAEADAPDNSVFCAEYQYAGRGRRGRPWHAIPGGSLTFSVLFRFDEGIAALVGLSLAVGVAIARALNQYSAYPVRLKWPNDVLVDYRKLAGILVEIRGDLQGPSYAVVGIGLNVRLPSAQRESIDQGVIDLDEMHVAMGRNALLAVCLFELANVMGVMRREGFSAVRAEWEAAHAHAGQPVSLFLPDGQVVLGEALGVDNTGALLLKTANGERIAFNAGEVRLRAGRNLP